MRYRFAFLAAAIGIAFITPASAVTTAKWTLAGSDALGTGTLDRVVLGSDGRLALGVSTRPVPDLGKEVWASAVAGGRIYCGTGTPARVFRIGDEGPVPVFTPPESALAVTALAAVGGSLVCGTLPDGRIHVLEAASGALARSVQIDAAYVWDIVPTEANRCLVATGPGGKVFEVDVRAGTARLYATLAETNVLALAAGRDGAVYAGTGGRGRLFRIDGGTPSVLWDFGTDFEVRSLALARDRLYLGVNRIEVQEGSQAAGDQTLGMVDMIQMQQALEGPGSVNLPGAIQGPGMSPIASIGGEIWVRDAAGGMERLFAAADEYFIDLGVDAGGRLLASTGRTGRIYALEGARRRSILHDASEDQVLTLAVDDRGALRFAGTGNSGTGVVFGPGRAEQGTYTSPVLDAGYPAEWGTIEWRATGPVTVETRSGNTHEPDDGWSAWSPALIETPTRVPSAPARFLQYRVTWAGEGVAAVVESVEVAYLVRNRRPFIQDVSVTAAAPDGGDAPPATEPPSMAPGADGDGSLVVGVQVAVAPHAAAKTIAWTADAVDGDALVYRLSYRRVEEDAWMPIVPGPRGGEPLAETTYRWTTDGIADGYYIVRVTASDEASNPASGALTDEITTEPFLVDNRSPDVTIEASPGAGSRAIVRGVAEDSFSDIARIEYSVDGGPWRFVYPRDRIYDHRVEPFDIDLGALPAGPHVVSVRAYDSDGNIGVGRREIR